MPRQRLSVQLCVINLITRQYGPHPTSDLLGVDYLRAYPPDTEFPKTIPSMDVFVRFFVENLTRRKIAVRVWRLYSDGTNRELVGKYRFEVPFEPEEVLHERVFRLKNLNVPGEGVYAVRICRRVKPGWEGMRWRTIGADYFHVVRS